MELIVYGRDEIEQGIIVRTPYIVVSISDSDSEPAKLIKGCGFLDAIYLSFDDTDPKYSFGKKPMTLEQAKSIWEFVKTNCDQAGTIVCHCLAGMSRSPAIALALAEAFEEDTSTFTENFNYNQHVYKTMKQAILHEE